MSRGRYSSCGPRDESESIWGIIALCFICPPFLLLLIAGFIINAIAVSQIEIYEEEAKAKENQ